MNCNESIQRIIRNLHYIIIYADCFYFLTAIFAFIFALFKKQKIMYLFTFLFILVVFDSAMNHGYHTKVWHIIDLISASAGCYLLILYLLYIWYRYKKIPMWSAGVIAILLAFTILLMTLSAITGSKLKEMGVPTTVYDPSYPLDPNKGIFGPITEEEKDYKAYELQIMKFYFHSFFHLISGITTLMAIIWLGVYN